MTARLETAVETDQDRGVLRELRGLEGRATVGDVMTRTGLAQPEAEASLRRLLESRRGHLEVGESGALVYRFESGFIRRDEEPFWSRFKRSAWEVFKTGFKVWTLVMLVVYLVVFVALLVAAVFAGKKGDSDGGWGGGGGDRRHGHGHGGLPNFFLWYWLWSPGWGWGRPYYGDRWEQRVGADKARVPLYKKVFAFVFGPDRPKPTQAQKDRSALRLIRSRRGVVTAADLVQVTGLRRHEAEEELARLVASYDGDVKVGEGGVLVYVFPELMVSAHGRVADKVPDPAWRRLEPPVHVTGNSQATDFAVGAVNAFNLVAAATAPLFIFPRLGLGGPAAWLALVWVPLIFSTMFFGIPMLRSLGVRRENKERGERNLRKLLLSDVYRSALVGDGAQPLTAQSAAAGAAKLTQKKVGPKQVEAEMTRLSADWDADVSASPDGTIEYRFGDVREEFRAADQVRDALALEKREVGEIVYSSGDTPSEESAREAKAFDKALASGDRELGTGARRNLAGYLSSTERAAYVDDFELVAFDEELKRRTVARTS